MYQWTSEVLIRAIEGVHHKTIIGKEVHPSSVIDDCGVCNLDKSEELLSSEFHSIRT